MSKSSIYLAAVVWLAWLFAMFGFGNWHLFSDNWFMTLTMVVGSFIAGATSEGGGAVAFPVMTLGFNIAPSVARDFSLMIQSVGMTAAALGIFAMGIKVEKNALIYSSIGGALGILLGVNIVLPPPVVKMFFVSLWGSFAVALYLINSRKKRKIFDNIQNFTDSKALLLTVVGFIGGIISGLTGSGLDIATFVLLVLAFGVSETVATPTSVILMAFNALVGFAYKGFAGSLEPTAWNYWWVCVPVVVIGAPIGAWFIKNKSRAFVANVLYGSILAQVVAALIILPHTTVLLSIAAGTFLAGSTGFYLLGLYGQAMIPEIELYNRPLKEVKFPKQPYVYHHYNESKIKPISKMPKVRW